MKKILSFTSRKITRAIFEYKMIRPGDRILTAVSGGKDSLILAYNLSKMMNSFPIPFICNFIHIKTEFSDPGEEEFLKNCFDSWNQPLIHIELNVMDLLKERKSMSCYWCASLRRKTLLKYALDNNYQSLALGHHMDDILESLLMNMVYNKEISVMVPHLLYETGPVRLIRPLSLLAENHLVEAAVKLEFPEKSCKCPYEKESRRKEVRTALDLLTGNSPLLKKNMFESLNQLKLDFLPQEALKKVENEINH